MPAFQKPKTGNKFKRVNQNITVKRPVSGRFGDFCPECGQSLTGFEQSRGDGDQIPRPRSRPEQRPAGIRQSRVELRR